mmetsp:Transcript_52210/g.130059  ORF Transcript_52210/g.130059 Transcript_52210/m.130059 type:complete len:307 (-) Transcript_52210:49-969(-)
MLRALLRLVTLATLACGACDGKPQPPEISKHASLGSNFLWDCKTAGHAGTCGKLNRSTATYELIDKLDIGVVTDFLQEDAARFILEKIKAIPEEEWMQIDNRKKRSFGNNKRGYKPTVDMDYKAYDLQLSNHQHLRAAVEPLFAPYFQGDNQQLSLFFGRYRHGSYVTTHTDGAVVTLNGEDRWDRKRAFLLYLNDGWTEEDGGLFTDEEDTGHPKYTPGWNTLLTFRVPRWHLVTPVKAHKVRWSIYGWSLSEQPTDWERFVTFVTTQPLMALAWLAGGMACFAAFVMLLKLLVPEKSPAPVKAD